MTMLVLIGSWLISQQATTYWFARSGLCASFVSILADPQFIRCLRVSCVDFFVYLFLVSCDTACLDRLVVYFSAGDDLVVGGVRALCLFVSISADSQFIRCLRVSFSASSVYLHRVSCDNSCLDWSVVCFSSNGRSIQSSEFSHFYSSWRVANV